MAFNKQQFDGWRQGNKRVFDEACASLWDGFYNVALYYLTKLGIDEDLAKNLASDAFWDAMEELDVMISGGQFLVEPISEPGKEGKTKGKVSDRELSPRDPIEWRGEEPFLKLAHRICIWRCIGRLRQWDPVAVALLSLVNAADEDEEGLISEEMIPGELLSPEVWLLDCDGLLWFVRDLARASEMLEKKPACRELVEATIAHIKVKVAQCNSNWNGRLSQEIAATTIEELVKGADFKDFGANGTEWRQFLMDGLGLNRATLDQRIKRCVPLLIAIAASLRKQRGDA